MGPFSGVRVVELSTGISGAYASKLFGDSGADVTKVEPPDGDPLRSWPRGGADAGTGALFQYLSCGKASAVGRPDDEHVRELLEGADLVIDDAGERPEPFLDDLPERGVVRLSITPYGPGGPYTGRPATEFVVQAEAGSAVRRGSPDEVPYYAGGRITEYLAGSAGAVGAAAAVLRLRATGRGERVDVTWLDAATLGTNVYSDLMHRLLGRPTPTGPARKLEVPSIEPTLDGWVGFSTNSRVQLESFLMLIDQYSDEAVQAFATLDKRRLRMAEWNAMVRAWTSQRSTAEIVEQASLFRIPVAPVHSGRSVLTDDHLRERGAFVDNPCGGFAQPRPPMIVDGVPLAPKRAVSAGPALDESTAGRPRERTPASGGTTLPLSGVRIVDCTSWWAGPSGAGLLAALGADVIHVESCVRLDGARTTGGSVAPAGGPWWEYGAMFLASNTNKRSLAVELSTEPGREILRRLIASADVVMENFSPRVFEGFGLDAAGVAKINPRAVFVRMPAFGLSGPWRDAVGFAQTMEQMTGLAWMTGPPGQPRAQQGPCDPLAGAHGAFAVLAGLAQRDLTSRGCHIEVPMVEVALNAAAEQIVDWTAYSREVAGDGNRSVHAAPQGLYRCAGDEHWLAISCELDAQWDGLRRALGDPVWATAPELATFAGRRTHHDAIDRHLESWAESRDVDDTVELLIEHGVPAGRGQDPRYYSDHPQHLARRLHEHVDHPVVGHQPLPRPPFTYGSVGQWIRTPPPTIGQHNHEVLRELGYTEQQIDSLGADGVVGSTVAT
jgi:crotonobetainyl-CoA:carnitine CoA-transferase CaiB-like acyl-CoA transferase